MSQGAVILSQVGDSPSQSILRNLLCIVTFNFKTQIKMLESFFVCFLYEYIINFYYYFIVINFFFFFLKVTMYYLSAVYIQSSIVITKHLINLY